MKLLCGDGFKNLCDSFYRKNGTIVKLTKNNIYREPLVFIKTDHVLQVIEKVLQEPTRIITHNSDLCIDERHFAILDNSNLIHWYAQNVNIQHPKLSSIPIGIANAVWPHGDQGALNKHIANEVEKTNMVYANFSMHTNRPERSKCLRNIAKNDVHYIDGGLSFNDYLGELSRSYFCVSPNGNGIDCHKTWESLYLKTIPIVTSSINSERYSDLPILIIQDWDCFGDLKLNAELYYSIIGGFDISDLNIKNFFINT